MFRQIVDKIDDISTKMIEDIPHSFIQCFILFTEEGAVLRKHFRVKL